jgi:drug/metabolite transporter (DMT)-like permease
MLNSSSPLWPGVPLALGSAALFGASAPIAKLLVGSVSPQFVAGILYLGAGLGLAVFHFGRGVVGLARVEAPLQRRDIPWLAAVILFGGLLGPLLLMLGLALTSAASASLLLNLEGLATIAIAWLVYRENVDRRLLTGAAAILAGAAVLTWTGNALRLDVGGMLIAAACLCWGIDNNLTRKLAAADPVKIAMTKGLVAGAVNTGIAVAQGAGWPGVPVIAVGALVGFLGVGVSLLFFILALRHLGTARTGAYYSLAPFIGAILAVGLLGEPVTVTLLVAAALVAAGLWLHLTERHDHVHCHEALEHDHLHVHDVHHQHDHPGMEEPVSEPHSHWHMHAPMRHSHAHFPDLHHRHRHGPDDASAPGSGSGTASSGPTAGC